MDGFRSFLTKGRIDINVFIVKTKVIVKPPQCNVTDGPMYEVHVPLIDYSVEENISCQP